MVITNASDRSSVRPRLREALTASGFSGWQLPGSTPTIRLSRGGCLRTLSVSWLLTTRDTGNLMASAGDNVREDIEAAKARMATKFGGRRELKRLQDHVWPTEVVERMATGSYGGGLGLLVMTDKRLIFLREGIMSSTLEDFPFDKISSIQWSSGMLLGKITIFLSGNKGEIDQVDKKDGKAIADHVRSRISSLCEASVAEVPTPQQVTSPNATPSHLELLQQLHQMKEAGILSEDEFASKKAEILSRM